LPQGSNYGGQRALAMGKIGQLGSLVLKVTSLAVATYGSVVSTVKGEMKPWQLGVPEPVSPLAVQVHEFHDYLLWLITAITLFVLALLIYVCVRYRASNNPNPSKTTHHTIIEVIWTVVPVLILVVVAVPSFKTLYYGDRAVDPDMTVKVIANQWYWTYEYPDQDLSYDSYMVPKEEIDPKTQTYLLSVDNPLVVPVGKKVQILVTSNDVMHSFYLPSAVVQIYGIAGRINETWMQIDKEGIFYGQCNQICGINHSAMPIAVEALSPEKYQVWLSEAKKKFASTDSVTKVASVGNYN